VATSPIGSYAIVASAAGSTLSNYTVHETDGTLTVTKADLYITGPTLSRTYGDANPDLSGTYSGQKNSETFTISGTTTATATSPIGSYAIVASAAGSTLSNYTVHETDGTLTVTPRTASVAADAKSKTYGDANPALTATVTGTVNGDTLNYALATTATQFSNVAGYLITVTLGSNPNYSVTLTNGTLTIGQKAATVTANDKSKTYGDLNPPLTATVTGTVNGDVLSYTLSTAATQFSNVGGYPISVTLGSNGNYHVTPTNGTLTIGQKALTVTANSTNKVFGQALTFAGTEFTTSGLINGDTVNSVTLASAGAAAAALVGSYSITASSATGSGLGNYNIGYVPGTLTVTLSPTGASIYVLDATAGGALNLSGNASVNVSGNVVVDSSSSSAILASGNAAVTAGGVLVVGGVSNSGSAHVTKTGTPGATGDPLAGVPDVTGGSPQTPVNLGNNSTLTIGPGIYSQITVSGNATLTMKPGVYVIAGGGFTVSGNGNVKVSGPSDPVTGNGVMIYNAGTAYNATTGADGGTYGSFVLSGNGTVSLTPPTIAPYKGIIVFQARDNSRALTFSGNAMQGISGVIYAKKAQIVASGNGQIGPAKDAVSIVADTVTLSGNAIAQSVNLTAPSGTVAYSPAQIRTAYGINNVALDGKGQTIAIVAAYDNPSIYLSLDAFDTQFGLTTNGQSLYNQYGPASSFLTVLNQSGQSTSLPATDPSGAGTDNWEVEESLDVEWVHAMAPGAQIVLVEANSQSLSDLMAGVATAASQPGVSVVSMSWGFVEGLDVLASDEAMYDSYFTTPGVTFIASTGDSGAAVPQYPAFSPNVVAVGGTSLTLNADNSYNSETGWGYNSTSLGEFIGSGGGISQYETEPAYQQGVQSTGSRTTPDVSLVADPNTGAWISDPYNLPATSSFEIVGGTSLSAPAWAGLLAITNQGRVAAGASVLDSSSPNETQQALYMLPQSDYNVITSGSNGYAANSGYNLVTGLGTPIADHLVSDLVAYHGPSTTYTGPTVGALQSTTYTDTGVSTGTIMSALTVFDSFTITSNGAGHAHARSISLFARSAESRMTVQSPRDLFASGERTVNNGSVAILDQVLSTWNEPDTDSSHGTVAASLVPGALVAIGSSYAPQASQRDRLIVDPRSADVLLEQGVVTRSLYADSTPSIRRKPFGSSSL
jgi:hypothetical protein